MKNTKRFVCQNCSEVFPKWMGKCDNCQSWNTVVEDEIIATTATGGVVAKAADITPITKTAIKSQKLERYSSEMSSVDKVLGGGIAKGSIVVLAGQPGIGKSTLLMQVLSGLDKQAVDTVYITAEESVEQVYERSQRLKVKGQNLSLLASQSSEEIAATIEKHCPKVCVIDSIQTIRCAKLSSVAGTVSQVTHSIQMLSSVAKKVGTSLIIVGHVTKEGAMAGPKIMEHLVDVVLYLEGDRYESLRVLKTSKNRFGSTDESAILEMDESGLKEAQGISAHLVKHRSNSDGSAIACITEGNQPLMVEVQALVTPTNFGYAKRSAAGIEVNRLNILIAVLHKRAGIKLLDHDVYVSIAGGFNVRDTGVDLAVCASVASAFKNKALNANAAMFGEVGLGGEIKPTRLANARIKEAEKFKLNPIIGPKIDGKKPTSYQKVSTVAEAIKLLTN